MDRVQLIELTKKAEKGAVYEAENTHLIVENYNLKAAVKTLSQKLSTAQSDAVTYKEQRNKNRYALGALFLAVAVSVVLRIKKQFF